MPVARASILYGSLTALAHISARFGVIVALCTLFVVVAPDSSRAQSCCDTTGNVNGSPDNIIDILDLTYLVSYMFKSGPPPPCLDAADVNGAPTQIDILDLTYLVSWMFKSGPPPVPCASGLTFAQREAIFNAIDSVENANAAFPADSLAMQFVAYLLTQPIIEAAEVIDSISAWARFTDGRLFLMPNNRPPTGGGAKLPQYEEPVEGEDPQLTGFVPPARRYPSLNWSQLLKMKPEKAASSNQYELPSTIQARVVSTLSTTCFTPGKDIIDNLLQSTGYYLTSSDGSVNGMLGVGGDGVFYMDAHGGGGATRAGVIVRSIWTTTTCSNATETAFAGMLDANELTYMRMADRIPATGACGFHVRYAFTGLFVAQYMTFEPNSFVMINACKSDEISLRAGFQLAGASVYAGWSRNVSDGPANTAAEFLFDRMLGANNSTLTPRENPPQRPFDVMPLLHDMQNRGFDLDPATGALLRITRLQGGFDLLAPSITYMQVIEAGDSLEMVGFFGSDPGSHGRVIIGGTELPIISWEPWIITAFIPNTGAGSVGPVTVEVDGLTGPSSSVKRTSNVVNLTEWRGLFTYTKSEAGALQAKIEVNAHLRADIHAFRVAPHLPPDVNQYIIAGGAHDSYGTAMASDSFVYHWPDSDPPETWTYTWSGTRPLPGLWEQLSDGFLLQATVDASAKTMQLLLVGAVDSGLKETLVSSTQGQLHSVDMGLSIPSIVFDQFGIFLNLNLNNAWDIVGDQNSAVDCCSYDPDNPDVNHLLSWPLIQSSFPPDTTAAQ